MKILGFDPSLTASGYALGDELGVLNPPPDSKSGPARLEWILRRFLRLANAADLVVLEDYSYGSKGRSILDIAELGGLLRWSMWKIGKPLVLIAPGTLKKFATGNGNAKKGVMLGEAIRRLGYMGGDDNEADALWLREAGLQAYGLSRVQLPKAQLAALKAVEWPELAAR